MPHTPKAARGSQTPPRKPVKPRDPAKKSTPIPIASLHLNSQNTANSSARPTPNSNKRRATRKLHTTLIQSRTGEDDDVSKGSTEASVGNKRKRTPDNASATSRSAWPKAKQPAAEHSASTDSTLSGEEDEPLFIVLDEEDTLVGEESAIGNEITLIDPEGNEQAGDETPDRGKSKSPKIQPKRVRH